jgi:putative ABC transport system permease protein
MIKDYFALALKNLSKRKMRSWLTMLGIFISIATIFVLISLSVGLQGAVEEQFKSLGSDKFFIMPKGQFGPPGTSTPAPLTIKDFEIVEKVAGVNQATYFAMGNGEIIFKGEKKYFMVGGLPLERAQLFEEVGSYGAEDGRLLKEGDIGKVELGYDFGYGKLFSKQIRAGDRITINGKEFVVEGIMTKVGNPSDDSNIIISYEDAEELFNLNGRVDVIYAQVSEGEDVKTVADRTEKRLLNYRGLTKKTIDFSISTPEELLNSFKAILNILTVFLLGVAAISLLVGAIGITNTMYTSVLERTREIGIMKAIGAKNSDIMSIFLIESGLLGLVGGIIGVLLGYGLSKVVELIAAQSLGTDLLRAASPMYLIVGCLAFGFLVGAISGTLPAMRASKTNVVDALRYE